jgi:MFS family permease
VKLRRLLLPEALREMLTPALAILLLFQVLSGVLVSPMFALFPVYVEKHLRMSTDFSGSIRGIFVLAGGVVALFGGAACDLFGRKPSYLLAMTGVMAAGLMLLTANHALMVALAVYAGLMFGLGSVAGLSYVMDTSPRHTLALATACYFLAGTVGNALGSAGAGWIAGELANGYAVLGIGMTAGHGLLLVAAWRLLPPLPRPEVPRTLEALTGGYRELLLRREVWALLGLRFLPTVYWGTATFLMPLLLFRLTGSEKAAGYYTSVSLVVSAICQLMMGRIVDRVGPRVPVLASISLVTAACLAQGWLGSQPAGLVLSGLVGAGAAWSLSVTMTTLVQELSSEETKGRLLGMTHVAWSGGFLAGTLLSGHLAREHGQGPAAFLVSGAGCAIAILCALGVVGALRAEG